MAPILLSRLQTGEDLFLLPKHALVVSVNLTLYTAHFVRELANHSLKLVWMRRHQCTRRVLLLIVWRWLLLLMNRIVVARELMMLRLQEGMATVSIGTGQSMVHLMMAHVCFPLLLVLVHLVRL